MSNNHSPLTTFTSAIVLAIFGADPPRVEPEHARNSVYLQVLSQGFPLGGQGVRLPEPRLRDGQDADAQRTALGEVAGSDQALGELIRNSVTAPYIIKVRDTQAADGTIRAADLWFVVYAELAQLDPAREAARFDGKEAEAGNMTFQTRLLKAGDLRAAGIALPAETPGRHLWYGHIHGRLLDRIEFGVTNQVVGSQSSESIVIAARTDPAFDKPGPQGNGWRSIAASAGGPSQGTLKPYAGGISYTKISRLAFQPGALLVEMHGAFVEPQEWFQGAPILRSKFSVIAQDQIRTLRRELARRQGN
jgi:hypothetical protein